MLSCTTGQPLETGRPICVHPCLQNFLNQDLAIMLVIALGALSVVRSIVFKKARPLP